MKDWLRSFLKRFGSASFGGSVAQLASGTAIAQFVLLIASPILTRLFGPAQFGQFALFVGIAVILLEVVTLRYHLAIPLSNNQRDAFAVFAISLTAVGAMVTILMIIGLLLHEQLAAFLGVERPYLFLGLLCVVLIAQGSNLVLQYWAIRERQFGVVSRTRVVQGGTAAASQILLGFAGVTSVGLLVGHTTGQLVGNLSMLRSSWTGLKQASGGFSWTSAREQAVRHRRFPLFSIWSGVANTLSTQLPVLVLTGAFSPVAAGLYALAQRVLQAPVSVLGAAIGQVFLSHAGQSSPSELRVLARQVFQMLTRIALPLMALLAFVAPKLFELLFGPEWAEAGVIVQALAPWLLLVFISSPLSMIPSILGRQGREMVFQVSLLGARVVALLVGAVLADYLTAILAFAGVSFVWFAFFVVWNMSLVGVRWTTIVVTLVRELVRAALLLLPFWIALFISASSGQFWFFAGMLLSLATIAISSIRTVQKGWPK